MNKNTCTLCPRACGAKRDTRAGACGAGKNVKIARVGLHTWEEPCISYGNGSGTVFFSYCPLSCVFCQNYEISAGGVGREVSRDELCDIFLSVKEMGAVNLNLVNPTHYSEDIIYALEKVKDSLGIPVVYNTGGYDRAETLKNFSGLVDIYLPDIKYYSSEYSKKYSGAADYFSVAASAIGEMFRQVGYPEFDENGHITRGVLIRHLILPTLWRDSQNVLQYLANTYDTEKLYVSLMRQYFPCHRAEKYHEINRRLTTLEYDKVVSFAQELGIKNGYLQEKSSAEGTYVPDFDF